MENKETILKSTESLKQIVNNADKAGYLIPDTRAPGMPQTPSYKDHEEYEIKTVSKKDDGDNLSEIRCFDSPNIQGKESLDDTRVKNFSGVNFQELYCFTNARHEFFQKFDKCKNATSKEEREKMRVFSSINKNQEDRCMISMRIDNSNEAIVMQMMVDKFSEFAQLKKCGAADVVRSVRKCEADLYSIIGILK